MIFEIVCVSRVFWFHDFIKITLKTDFGAKEKNICSEKRTRDNMKICLLKDIFLFLCRLRYVAIQQSKFISCQKAFESETLA